IQPVGQRALAPSQQASISHQTYLDALQGLGMSEQQIKELAETKKLTDKVYILSPVTGFIIARDVSPGQRFEKGFEWYRIADLSRVWVIADLFQNDAEYVKPGMKAKIGISQSGREYQASVSKVLPQVDAVSRTLKVRFEIDNPGFVLKPDMYVDVEFSADLPHGISVPSEAVLDSGLRKTVFVDRGEGFFEPRQVETGWRTADRVQITKGLMAGEQIVVSGNFLIDSESRMKIAAAGALKKNTEQRVIDPVCGMEVVPKVSKGAGLFLDHGGQVLYFCAPECKEKFEKDPRRYGLTTDSKTVQTAPLPNAQLGKASVTDVKLRSSAEREKPQGSGPLAGSLPMNSKVGHP
ncbi:MAG TPA: efflux RND transporter periplasmic adaptor subunit, partial [Syntrophorhabdaceae bacterium]|nr:efflux RND transporter periplasmic adaptor subunit [Syntrophorhabdaceae bacterium]